VVLPIVAAVLVAPGPVRAHDDDDHPGGGGQPNDHLPVYLDRAPHPTAQDTCTPGFIWQGAGNPATNFQRKRNLDDGVELALKAIIRGGPDIRSTYVDGDGLVHIEVPSGEQAPGNGRAKWNFTYSYDVDLDPTNPTLDQYYGELWIDVDPSSRARYFRLTLARLFATPPSDCLEPDESGFGWKSGSTVVIADDEGYGKVTQNSENFGFSFIRSRIDANPYWPGVQTYNFGPAEFDLVLILARKGAYYHDDDDDDGGSGSRRFTVLHVVIDVVDTPTQTP
jgi:hypothetical protein